MTFLAVVGLGIAAYLLASRVLGEPPACGPVKGCETVAAERVRDDVRRSRGAFRRGVLGDPRDRLRHVVATR